MNNLLIVGCGDIAHRTIPLLKSHYRIYALIRNNAQHNTLRAQGVTPILGDLDDRASLLRLAGIADVVLHFAPPPNTKESPLAPPLPKGGSRSARTPPFNKGGMGGFDVSDTRTSHLLSALSQGRLPKRLIYISTTGVYGDCGGEYVSETHRLNPQSVRAKLRVSAEKQIRAWARHNQVSASILRVSGIYAADRLPLERLRAGVPVIAAEEDSYTNLIHADDLARIIVAALDRGKPNRVYHASDDSEMKMGDYFDAVADVRCMPRPPRISRAQAQKVLPESLLSFMNESRRLKNARIKQELKVELLYPFVYLHEKEL